MGSYSNRRNRSDSRDNRVRKRSHNQTRSRRDQGRFYERRYQRQYSRSRSRERRQKRRHNYSRSRSYDKRKYYEEKKHQNRSRSRDEQKKRHKNEKKQKSHRYSSEKKNKSQKKSHKNHKEDKNNHANHHQKNDSHQNNTNKKQSDSKDRSKDAGHYEYKLNEKIGKYELIKHVSDGTFGRVFEVKHLESGGIFALKMIRAVPRYVESAKTEEKIIRDIQERNKENKYSIVRIEDSFDFGKNYCLVFERLGPSLYDVIKKNGYKGFDYFQVKQFFRQILSSVGFLHEIGLTHTDLKPENILLRGKKLKVRGEMYSVESMQSQDTESEQSLKEQKFKRIFYEPENPEITIIDFGGATYDHEHHSSIINTRQYRAPEVIIKCCQWNNISDVWSIGCIMIELISGELLFPTHENFEHLAMIQKISGSIPNWMGQQAQDKAKKYFSKQQDGQITFNWPQNAEKESVSRVNKLPILSEIIAPEQNQLLSLIQLCLTIDPKKRISCQEALQHPYFKENSN